MPTVYLIHFSSPIGHPVHPNGQAQHYLGYTKDDDAKRRFDDHVEEGFRLVKQGKKTCGGVRSRRKGSPLVASAIAQGVEVCLVRTWEGGPQLERELKNRKNSKALCPICQEEVRERARLSMKKLRARRKTEKMQRKLFKET